MLSENATRLLASVWPGKTGMEKILIHVRAFGKWEQFPARASLMVWTVGIKFGRFALISNRMSSFT